MENEEFVVLDMILKFQTWRASYVHALFSIHAFQEIKDRFLKAVCIFLFFIHIFQDIMVTVFENGKLLKDYSFDEVRENAEIDLVKKNIPANQTMSANHGRAAGVHGTGNRGLQKHGNIFPCCSSGTTGNMETRKHLSILPALASPQLVTHGTSCHPANFIIPTAGDTWNILPPCQLQQYHSW